MSFNELLSKTGQTEAAVIRDYLIMTAWSKLSRYEAECALFEKKHNESLEFFKERVMQNKGEEDFSNEDDLMDWEYADSALRWWRSQIKELQHVG